MAHLIRDSCRLDGDAPRAVDLANHSCRNAVPPRDGEQRLRLRGDEHESDAHVEGTEHLLCRNAALLDLLEYPRDRQQRGDAEADVLPQPAELQEAAPGDVVHRVDALAMGAQHLQHRLDVNPRGLQQRVANAHPGIERIPCVSMAEQNLSRERKAVRVDAAAGKPHYRVPFPRGAAGDDRALVHQPEACPREVEPSPLDAGDDAGKGCGLAADDGDAPLPRAFGKSGRYPPDHLRVVALDSEIVHHGDGLSADAEHVVDIHGNAVDADGVVLPELLRDKDLGAHSVHAQHRQLLPDAHVIREVALGRQHLTKLSVAMGEGPGKCGSERGDGGVLRHDIDPCLCIGRHSHPSARIYIKVYNLSASSSTSAWLLYKDLYNGVHDGSLLKTRVLGRKPLNL